MPRCPDAGHASALSSLPRLLPGGRAELGGQEEEDEALAGSPREPKPRHPRQLAEGKKRGDEQDVRPRREQKPNTHPGAPRPEGQLGTPGESRPRPGPARVAGPSAPVTAPGSPARRAGQRAAPVRSRRRVGQRLEGSPARARRRKRKGKSGDGRGRLLTATNPRPGPVAGGAHAPRPGAGPGQCGRGGRGRRRDLRPTRPRGRGALLTPAEPVRSAHSATGGVRAAAPRLAGPAVAPLPGGAAGGARVHARVGARASPGPPRAHAPAAPASLRVPLRRGPGAHRTRVSRGRKVIAALFSSAFFSLFVP